MLVTLAKNTARRDSGLAGVSRGASVIDADNRELLEYDGTSGQAQHWYAFGLGPDAVLNQMNVPLATRATMIPDIQGSIVATLDSGTGALTKMGYQPYGENLANLGGTFRYTGRRLDAETGGSAAEPAALYYYRARTYSPTWGRFLQPDPIGYAGGNNLYAYVNDDPLNFVDPQGLVLEGLSAGVNAGLAGNDTDLLNIFSSGSTAARIGGGAGLVGGFVARTSLEAGAFLVGEGLLRGALGVGSTIPNPVPTTLARVIPEGIPATTLGRPGTADVFVTAAEDISGMNSAQIAQRLGIPQSSTGFKVIEFPTPQTGLASPVFRTEAGFVVGGRTAGGAREFVIPNQAIPTGATIRTVP